jgi:hypothetical protein
MEIYFIEEKTPKKDFHGSKKYVENPLKNAKIPLFLIPLLP